ncbi:MAG: NAD(P)/FAD-dependent oxidoreductase [Nitrospirota bacterium]
MKPFYDIAVIGAGIGGLTAGALLAKKGHSVAVFEAGDVPGGYCTTFRRRGFTFDSCLDAVSGWGEDGWLRKIFHKLGIENQVELLRLDPLRVDNFAGDIVNVPGTIPELINLLYGIAPKEKEGILSLLDAMEEIYRTAMATPPEMLYTCSTIKGAAGKYRGRSYKELLDEFIKDPKARAVMCDRCAFLGLPPSKVSAIAMTIMFMTYAVGGGYRIKGGAGNLTGALVGALRENGGELHVKAPVSKILTDGGRACGVAVQGGEIRANAVISAADAAESCRMAGIDAESKKPSISFFMVYLGLKDAPPVPDSMGYYPGNDIEATFGDVAHDIASPNASLEIINYSGLSPEMAPAGHASIMLMSKAKYVYSMPWKKCKYRESERLIALAERAVPGLRDSIIFKEPATPPTLERYTGNSLGAAFGWEQDVSNARTSSRPHLPGLYFAGHWTYPGGGIESVAASGLAAAEGAAAWINKEAFN